jgi:NADH-quinone oxidoreductase subunit H
MYEILKNIFGSDILAYIIGAALPLFIFVLPFALFAVYLERKVSGFMQDRLGPMRTGPYGILQTIADILKLIQKEDITASETDKKFFNLAPYLTFAGSYAAFAAIPFSGMYIGTGAEVGIFFIVAVSSLVVAGLLMAGWSSNNKYSLLGTLSLEKMTQMQTAYFWNWMILGGGDWGLTKLLLIPFMIVAFIIFYISSLAEVNRTPFDIPEAESELVAGYHTEYSGMKFAIFFLAEYANMFAVSAIAASIFFGGYQSPFGYFGNLIGVEWLIPLEQLFWFTMKGLFFVFVQMWLRWTLPRLRVDQLMTVCWKYLIPYAFVNLIIIGLISLI